MGETAVPLPSLRVSVVGGQNGRYQRFSVARRARSVHHFAASTGAGGVVPGAGAAAAPQTRMATGVGGGAADHPLPLCRRGEAGDEGNGRVP